MPPRSRPRPKRQFPVADAPRVPRPPQTEGPEVVDPVWLLKAAGSVALLGLLCAYLTLCAFFYTGQWQFVLHPSRTVAQNPGSVGLPFDPVRFGDDHSGQPQLTGWWIPSGHETSATVLVLHGQTGSMSEAVPLVKAFHEVGLNAFVFDYRGYGQSEGRHPTESLMRHDAEAAREYLLQARRIPAKQVVVAGTGLAASLAVNLCATHSETPALVLIDADGDTASRVEADQRSHILPVQLLFHERFPLADRLHTLATPKLLISFTRGEAPEIYQRAAAPKISGEIDPGAGPAGMQTLLRRFLDEYGIQ